MTKAEEIKERRREAKLDELMATRRWCYHIPKEAGFVEGHGWRVSIVIEGVEGHYPTGDLEFGKPHHKEPWFWGDTYEDAEQVAAEANMKLGYSESDIVKIITSSFSGRRRGRK